MVNKVTCKRSLKTTCFWHLCIASLRFCLHFIKILMTMTQLLPLVQDFSSYMYIYKNYIVLCIYVYIYIYTYVHTYVCMWVKESQEKRVTWGCPCGQLNTSRAETVQQITKPMLLRPRGESWVLGHHCCWCQAPVCPSWYWLSWPCSKGVQGTAGNFFLQFWSELSPWTQCLTASRVVQPQQRWPSWSRFKLHGLVTSAPHPYFPGHEEENLSLLHAPMKQTFYEENTNAFKN